MIKRPWLKEEISHVLAQSSLFDSRVAELATHPGTNSNFGDPFCLPVSEADGAAAASGRHPSLVFPVRSRTSDIQYDGNTYSRPLQLTRNEMGEQLRQYPLVIMSIDDSGVQAETATSSSAPDFVPQRRIYNLTVCDGAHKIKARMSDQSVAQGGAEGTQQSQAESALVKIKPATIFFVMDADISVRFFDLTADVSTDLLYLDLKHIAVYMVSQADFSRNKKARYLTDDSFNIRSDLLLTTCVIGANKTAFGVRNVERSRIPLPCVGVQADMNPLQFFSHAWKAEMGVEPSHETRHGPGIHSEQSAAQRTAVVQIPQSSYTQDNRTKQQQLPVVLQQGVEVSVVGRGQVIAAETDHGQTPQRFIMSQGVERIMDDIQGRLMAQSTAVEPMIRPPSEAGLPPPPPPSPEEKLVRVAAQHTAMDLEGVLASPPKNGHGQETPPLSIHDYVPTQPTEEQVHVQSPAHSKHNLGTQQSGNAADQGSAVMNTSHGSGASIPLLTTQVPSQPHRSEDSSSTESVGAAVPQSAKPQLSQQVDVAIDATAPIFTNSLNAPSKKGHNDGEATKHIEPKGGENVPRNANVSAGTSALPVAEFGAGPEKIASNTAVTAAGKKNGKANQRNAAAMGFQTQERDGTLRETDEIESFNENQENVAPGNGLSRPVTSSAPNQSHEPMQMDADTGIDRIVNEALQYFAEDLDVLDLWDEEHDARTRLNRSVAGNAVMRPCSKSDASGLPPKLVSLFETVRKQAFAIGDEEERAHARSSPNAVRRASPGFAAMKSEPDKRMAEPAIVPSQMVPSLKPKQSQAETVQAAHPSKQSQAEPMHTKEGVVVKADTHELDTTLQKPVNGQGVEEALAEGSLPSTAVKEPKLSPLEHAEKEVVVSKGLENPDETKERAKQAVVHEPRDEEITEDGKSKRSKAAEAGSSKDPAQVIGHGQPVATREAAHQAMDDLLNQYLLTHPDSSDTGNARKRQKRESCTTQ